MDRKAFRKLLRNGNPNDFKQDDRRDRHTSCPYKRQMITGDECQEIGSDVETNRNGCTKLECPISTRLCLPCLTFGLAEYVSESGKPYCSFHEMRGAAARPSRMPKSAA